MGGIGEGVFTESVDVLVTAGGEVLEVGLVDWIAFGPQLLEYFLHVVDGVPEQHAVGEQRQAPGRLCLRLLLLTADNAFAAKPEPGPQRVQFLALVELGVDALAQGLALQVAQE